MVASIVALVQMVGSFFRVLNLDAVGHASVSVVYRVLRLGIRLLKRQLNRSTEEAGRDAKRIAIGVLLISFGMLFALLVLMMVHIFFGVLMTTSGLSTLASVSILLGVDALLCVLFLLIGFLLARQPVLVETRKELQELLELLSDEVKAPAQR
mgnify:CR=1 FL=1